MLHFTLWFILGGAAYGIGLTNYYIQKNIVTSSLVKLGPPALSNHNIIHFRNARLIEDDTMDKMLYQGLSRKMPDELAQDVDKRGNCLA